MFNSIVMKKIAIVLIFLSGILVFNACVSKEEKANLAMNEGKKKARKFDFQGAIKEFSKALQYKPDFSQAYYQRGTAYFNAKIYDSAMMDYNVCLKMDAKQNDVLAARGTLKFVLGDRDGACSDWTAAKELGNENLSEKLMNCTH
jgi:Flp pilus assembly protein TadD